MNYETLNFNSLKERTAEFVLALPESTVEPAVEPTVPFFKARSLKVILGSEKHSFLPGLGHKKLLSYNL